MSDKEHYTFPGPTCSECPHTQVGLVKLQGVIIGSLNHQTITAKHTFIYKNIYIIAHAHSPYNTVMYYTSSPLKSLRGAAGSLRVTSSGWWNCCCCWPVIMRSLSFSGLHFVSYYFYLFITRSWVTSLYVLITLLKKKARGVLGLRGVTAQGVLWQHTRVLS